jgi:hypothetical protein
MWHKETIPDASDVFMRVHKRWVIDGAIAPGVFRDHGRGMSVDWSKYSCPEGTRQRAKTPNDNGVIALNVGRIRAEVELEVEHDPVQERVINDAPGSSIPANRAHSEVLGEKSTERRLKLVRIHSIVISPPGWRRH